MNTQLAIELSEQAFLSLSDEATIAGKSPAELAASVVENVYGVIRAGSSDAGAARSQFERCFGSIDLGRPIGIGNEAIDSDLARGYGPTTGCA